MVAELVSFVSQIVCHVEEERNDLVTTCLNLLVKLTYNLRLEIKKLIHLGNMHRS